MMKPPIWFKPLSESDLPLMLDWLNREHMREWWGAERTISEVQSKYLPRIAGNDAAIPFLVYLGTTPIGYIQYYRAAYGEPAWWPDTPRQCVFGIDQFIGDADRLGQRIGRTMIASFCERLFVMHGACEIRVDPKPDNIRAIRCYESVGFISNGPITTPDGPSIWMALEPDQLNQNLIPAVVSGQVQSDSAL